MTRTLHNTLMALSTTGLMLAIALVAGMPLAPVPQARPTGADALSLDARSIEASATVAEDSSEALALAAAFMATTTAEVAIASAIADAHADADAAHSAASKPGSGRQNRSGRRSARRAIALPYFSFARGLRRGTGG